MNLRLRAFAPACTCACVYMRLRVCAPLCVRACVCLGLLCPFNPRTTTNLHCHLVVDIEGKQGSETRAPPGVPLSEFIVTAVSFEGVLPVNPVDNVNRPHSYVLHYVVFVICQDLWNN